MTREEHIIYLKNLRTALKLANNFSNETMESLNKAIEALEAEPCGDAISRKWVLDVVNNFVFDTETDRNRIIHIVRDTAPSVTPEQKTGKWIKLKDQKPEAYENVLVKDIDGDVTCAYACEDIRDVNIEFYERFSGELVDDVIEWRRIPE